MAKERIPDEEWEKKVKPNLATMPTEMLIELSKALTAEDFEKQKKILEDSLKKKDDN